MRPPQLARLLLAVALLTLPVALPAATAGAIAAAPGAQSTPAPPPVLPEPTFQSVAEEVLVTMDDGVRLAATVTYPSVDGQVRAPGQFPVVLALTPYSRNGTCGCIPPTLFATRGMAAVVVDVRGTGGSEGDLSENFFSPREARDGAALVEHFGSQEWSTGKVGMAGGSYVGITQLLTAAQQPEHLAAIVPIVAISDLYRDGFAHGGIPNFNFDAQYIAVQGAPGAAGSNNDPALLEMSLLAKLGQSPPGTIAFDYLERPEDDDFYRDRSPINGLDKITVPVLNMGNWRDGLLRGQTENFIRLAQRPGVETRLYMDPCTHKGCGPPFAPFTDPPGQNDSSAVMFEFLGRHLRGTAIPDRPLVEFFVQGADAYATSSQWPPTGTRYDRLPLGDGTLGEAAEGSGEYVTNPAAGFSLAFNKYGTVAGTPYVPTDQRLEGHNGLTFRTPVLEVPLRLTGPLALHLVAASTAVETDWYAKVSDVSPDGTESIVTEGALRASHRELDPAKSTPERPYHTHTDPQPIEPGRFYGYDIEIWPTAYELPAGHRLQLRVTSSDLPTHLPGTYVFDRAAPLDTRVELNPMATNTIRYGESFLQVPVSGAAAAPPVAVPAPAGAQPDASAQPGAAPSGSLPATGSAPWWAATGAGVLLATMLLRRRDARTG